MRTTNSRPEWFRPLEEALMGPVRDALFGSSGRFIERDILGLPCRYGGMGMPNPCDLVPVEDDASRFITNDLRASILAGDDDLPDASNSRQRMKQTHNDRNALHERRAKEIEMRLSGRLAVAFK